MENKKDKLVELNGLVNTLAINVDSMLKNYVRMENKSNEVLECEEVGNLELSLKYKEQMKNVAELLIDRKAKAKSLIARLEELINELD